MNRNTTLAALLRATTAFSAAAMLTTPARAQEAAQQAPDTAKDSNANAPTAPASVPAVPASNTNEGAVDEGIVVTGTLFRRTTTETPSPVTVLSAETLARRGLTTVSDAVRSLSADNSGSVPTAFSAGFATGASGVSLRGLTVNSTLTIFDGLRGAFYPLPDDGQRSFVDLNTIPQVVIDRIEVLRDGASSTYGADAIGGVVNVITKKSFEGVQATAEAGVSQRGDAGEQRVSLLAGTGDLKSQGWNVYIGAEYQHDGLVMAKDRGFPFNTSDLTSIGGSNGDVGVTSGGSSISAVVRPATQTIPGNIFSGAPVPGGLYQVLSPNGCAAGTIAHTTSRGSFCEQDIYAAYSPIQPKQTRFGVTARASFRLGEATEAYVMGTYYQNRVFTPGFQSSIRQQSPILTTSIVLPARLTNGQLNPNDPYAAQGLAAQIFYRFGDVPASSETFTRTFRGAAGISGALGSNWRWNVEATGMHTALDITNRGYLNIAGLTKAITEGTYNFVDPSKNSDAIRQQIAPDVRTRATSELYMAQATLTGTLAQLPGGPLQLGLGAAARYEAVDAPSANPYSATLGLNAYSAKGHHNVEAGYFELDAPIVKQLEINASGRVDHYSEGYTRFSPKIGAKFTPIRQLALRGTYSQGFRAPQFAETAGSVIGYVSAPPIPCNIVLQHGGTATGTGCTGGSAYVTTPYRLGLNSTATPGIKPEKSRSFTLGAVFQPTPWFSMTADYFNIRKTDVILAGPDFGTALAAYYAGKPLPAGYTVTLNGTDPDFPNGTRTVAFVNSPYVNGASQKVSGIDVTALLQVKLAPRVKFSSQVEVTDLFHSTQTTEAGTSEWVGTQGPYQLSSGAGTPKWRGNWSNSLEWGPATLTATAYYTSGYKSTADDVSGPGTAGDCANAIKDVVFCHTKRFIDVDLVGSYQVNRNFAVYFNVTNLFDAKAPLNPANYAVLNYNPTWSQAGAIGRSFRIGAKVSL